MDFYDVVIYEKATGVVSAVVGEHLRRSHGFHNAERRAETAWSRVNDRYAVAIIPAGSYGKGDSMPAPVAP